jgi:hypothetical protein
MDTLEQIKIQKQSIARDEKSLALTKLKKRRADTRRKIELGGLVIKSGVNIHTKSVILGAFQYVYDLMENDPNYLKLFESMGSTTFYENK